jgi:hypothetical protein
MRAGVAMAAFMVPALASAATGWHGWVGRYQTTQTQLTARAKSDNYLTITQMSGGGYRLTFEAASAGCIGQVDFSEPRLPPGQDATVTNDEEGAVCVMRLHHEGDTVIAAEDGCDQFHGAECTFSGTYRRSR